MRFRTRGYRSSPVERLSCSVIRPARDTSTILRAFGTSSIRRTFCALTFAVLLSACGDDDDPPPPAPLSSVPHPIASTQGEARDIATLASRSARGGLRVVRDLDAFVDAQQVVEFLLPRLFGADIADDGSRVEVDCDRNPFRLAPILCLGSVELEANRREQNGSVTRGTFFSVQFDKFNLITPPFERLRISGGFRVDYLTDYASEPRTGTISYQSGGLSTNRDGNVIDARSGALTATYGDGSTILESDSRRYVDIDTASTSAADGSVRGGQIRTNLGAGYVDITYANWSVVAGVPQSGSSASITGADGSTVALVVTSNSATSVVFDATITTNGIPATFTVEIPIVEVLDD